MSGDQWQAPGWEQDGQQPPGWQPDDAGGGGGDTTPDAFGFVSQSGVPLSTLIESAAVTLLGFDTPTTIGAEPGLEYSLDGAPYTSDDGTAEPNQLVRVRLTSSPIHSTGITKGLTVGGVQGTFTVTTLAEDADLAVRVRVRVGAAAIVLIDPEDHAAIILEWVDELGEGVTLSSVEHTPPDGLNKEDESTISGNESRVVVSNAKHGTLYQIAARAQLSTGETIARSVTARGFNA